VLPVAFGRMLLNIASSLWRSPALRASSALGASGLALACGNLLLARVLPTAEFARFSLLFSLVMIGISIGPIGADVTLTRRRFEPDSKIHRQVLMTSSLVATAIVTCSAFAYPLPASLLATLLVSIVAGSVKTVAVAHYRSIQRFAAALMLTISTNMSLLVASVLAVSVGAQTAQLPAMALSLTLCITALIGWRAVAPASATAQSAERYSWGEGWAAVIFTAAGMILGAMERLLTPGLLGLRDLATFSVLATVAGSPFHMLHLGVGYTLLPALRNAKGHAARLSVLRHESLVILVIGAVAAIAVWFVTPLIVGWVLAGRYTIGSELLIAAVFGGVFKIIGSLAAAVVNAIGTGRHLVQLSVIGWLAIGVSVAGAAIGARWGLTGLVYGVGIGWLIRAIAIAWLATLTLQSTGR
jgi:O-antigen/teichoic acid export membrane protein